MTLPCPDCFVRPLEETCREATPSRPSSARPRRASAPDERAPLGPALEPNLYLEPEIVRLEQRAIFERTWQLAGHVSDLAEPGSYLTTEVVDQPVLVVRDHDGEIRAFRNVCRHRGSRLLAGSGQCGKAIRCLYHGWTYRLDGAPHRRARGPRHRRPRQVPPRPAPGPRRGVLRPDLRQPRPRRRAAGRAPRRPGRAPRALRPARASKRFGRGGDVQPANWKVVVENYIEGYHIPIAHPSLMRLLDYQRYDVEVHDDWVWFEAPMRDKPSDNRLERALPAARAPGARPRARGPARLALRPHLPEHDDRPLPRPGEHLAAVARRRGRHARRLGHVPPPGRAARRAASCSGSTTCSTRRC